MEISEILQPVQDDDLQKCILKLFYECDTPVDPANIEACHLKSKPKTKKVIIKLSKRTDISRVKRN